MSNAHKHSRHNNGSVPRVSTRVDSGSNRSILWYSNSPTTPTGYGTQTAQVTSRFSADGHKVAIASNYGLEGTTTHWKNVKIFPRGYELHSNDTIAAHYLAWQHETGKTPVMITLYDTWVLQGKTWDVPDRVYSWVPIDHQPAPMRVMQWLKRSNVTPIAMSNFGRQMIEDAGVECLYIPHAIEDVFKPSEFPVAGMTAREFMDVPEDAFLVGMNSANKGTVPNRKSFPESFLAFSAFANAHADAVLYVHTESHGSMGGINLEMLAKQCGIKDSQIRFVDQYAHRIGISPEILASIYSSMNVLLQPSMGEGFGIPAVEAQACGTPVIVSDATAQPELCGAGWMVATQHSYTLQHSWQFTPQIDSILDALNQAYDQADGLADQAIEFAEQYRADFVYEKAWRPFIEQA